MRRSFSSWAAVTRASARRHCAQRQLRWGKSGRERSSGRRLALARAVASKDGYSTSHVEHVANHAAMLAEAMELDFAQVKIVKYGAILHNVGKIAIPRPGNLHFFDVRGEFG